MIYSERVIGTAVWLRVLINCEVNYIGIPNNRKVSVMCFGRNRTDAGSAPIALLRIALQYREKAMKCFTFNSYFLQQACSFGTRLPRLHTELTTSPMSHKAALSLALRMEMLLTVEENVAPRRKVMEVTFSLPDHQLRGRNCLGGLFNFRKSQRHKISHLTEAACSAAMWNMMRYA